MTLTLRDRLIPVTNLGKMLFINTFVKHSQNVRVFGQAVRHFCCTEVKRKRSFAGVLCDIDGVLLRGRQLIPGARESMKTLYEKNIPVVFVTNQGLQLETDKAQSLSEILDIQVLNSGIDSPCSIWLVRTCFHFHIFLSIYDL